MHDINISLVVFKEKSHLYSSIYVCLHLLTTHMHDCVFVCKSEELSWALTFYRVFQRFNSDHHVWKSFYLFNYFNSALISILYICYFYEVKYNSQSNQSVN